MAASPVPAQPAAPTPNPRIKEESAAYLRSLLNKNLRITTTDNRMFWGAFKCTDYESNIVLHHTFEYRHPTLTEEQVSDAAAAVEEKATTRSTAAPATSETGTGTGTGTRAGADAANAPSPSPSPHTPAGGTGREGEGGEEEKGGNGGTIKLDMTSRYLGLVVVPGKYIVRIEVEEFASQRRGRQGGRE